MLATLRGNANRLGLDGRDRRRRRHRAAVRGRELRPRARPRRAAPPARPRALLRRVLPRAATRRHAVLRRRALALGRPHRRDPQARRRRAPRRCGAARSRARPGAAHANGDDQGPSAPDDHALEPSSTSTPSSPPTSSAAPPARASPMSASAARSCWRTGSAGSTARSSPRPSPRTSRWPLDPVRLPRLPAAAARRPPRARAAPAAADLLQPDARRAQAGLARVESGGAPDRPPPTPLALLTDKRAALDTGARAGGLRASSTRSRTAHRRLRRGRPRGAGAVERLVRRKPVVNAIGGVLGTGAGRVHRAALRHASRLLRPADALRSRARGPSSPARR